MNALYKKRGQRGFTLIELIVVIAVLAILAAVLLPRFIGFTENAHEKSALADAKNIATAFEAIVAEGDTPDVGLVEGYLGRDIDEFNNGDTSVECKIDAGDIDAGGFAYQKAWASGDSYVVYYDADSGYLGLQAPTTPSNP